jgi:Mn2+/Fe2+ NRAMP family transporter
MIGLKMFHQTSKNPSCYFWARWQFPLHSLSSSCLWPAIHLRADIQLHANGHKNVETTRQAAEALRPLTGWFAATLYTVGLVGVGLLAIPTLVGSSAYAFAETFGWRQGLDESYRAARPFYAIIIISTLAAIGLYFSAIHPVQALFWSAVLNGMLAPFMLVGILLVASDRELMHNRAPRSPASSWRSRR